MIFVKIFQPAKALEIFLLSADSAIYIRGYPEPRQFRKGGFAIIAKLGRYALGGFQPQGIFK